MKFTLALVLSFAVIVSCSGNKTNKNQNHNQDCGKKIKEALIKLTEKALKNKTLKNEFLAAFENAQLNEYLIVTNKSKKINSTALIRDYFSVVPKIVAIAADLKIPNKYQTKLIALNNSIEQVKQNQTVENRFAGILLQHDLGDGILSGCFPSLQVNFDSVQENRKAAKMLACYLTGHKEKATK